MQDIGHWTFPKEFKIEDWVGFIYRIVDLDTNKEYLGKKFFFSTIRKKIKNKTNRKKITKESNWKSYTGSCKELNEQIALRGKDRFLFKIESLHSSRSSLAYKEVEEQILNNVMREKLPNGEKKFYNGLICPIRFKINDPTVEELAYDIRNIC